MTNNTLQLTATNIRYLIAIHKLGGAEKFVKCTDIAKNLSVTRPSVHAMVKTLSEMNLIEKPHYGKVNFTHYGKETAQIYIDSYDTVCGFFTGVIPPEVNIDAVVCAFMSQIDANRLKVVCANIRNLDFTVKQ